MRTATRGTALAFSLGMHALLLGGFLLLARDVTTSTERVYRVALAELAPTPSQPAPAQAAPEPPAPPPQPPEEPQPQPKEAVQEVPKPLPKPDVKKISPKKREKAAPKAKPAPTPLPRPAVSSAPAGPVPRNVGGLSAYDNDALDQRPSITRRVAPEYPTKARRMNVQGTVTVQLVVDTAGKPRNCVVVKATPGGYFEEAALDAARSMRFVPGKLKGQPVNTLVQLPFAFRLR